MSPSIPLLLLSTALAASAAAAPPGPATEIAAPNWDRELAQQRVAASDTQAPLDRLRDALFNGPRDELLPALRAVATDPDLPMPAREAVLYRLAGEMSQLSRDEVDPQAVDYLRDWQARTLVPFEEYPRAGVPLYNVAGAAHGTLNRWRRDDGTRLGRERLRADPGAFVAGWLAEPDSAVRRGYLDAIAEGSTAAITDVQRLALARLPEAPELTPLAAYSSLAIGDILAIEHVIAHGSGSELRPVLSAIGPLLYPVEAAGLIAGLVDQAPAANVGLAIAAWSPHLAGRPPAETLLIDLLDHPELGAGAALALTVQPTFGALSALSELAVGDDLAAARAQMALEALEEERP